MKNLNFTSKKISPDIVYLLSSHELRQLGVTNREEMVALRNECVRFGMNKPCKVSGFGGPPAFQIPKYLIWRFHYIWYSKAFICVRKNSISQNAAIQYLQIKIVRMSHIRCHYPMLSMNAAFGSSKLHSCACAIELPLSL